MRSLDLPAGSRIRLIATARAGTDLHHWDVLVMTAGEAGAAPRLAFSSQIGEHDLDQRIDIPPQDADCRVEIRSRHSGRDGWNDDRCTVQEDTPDELRIGFCNPARPGSRADDLVLSFSIGGPPRASDKEPDDGQRPEAI